MKRKKILAISGSTKANSTNGIILRSISDWFADELDVQVFSGISSLPHFNPDITEEAIAASIREFRSLIEEADGVIICTPEYVFSLPGSLKNAIEWTVSTTVFSHKPVALIVASASGEKAFEALKLIMRTIECKVVEQSTLLIRGAKGKINKEGQIVEENLRSDLQKVIATLITTMNEGNTIA